MMFLVMVSDFSRDAWISRSNQGLFNREKKLCVAHFKLCIIIIQLSFSLWWSRKPILLEVSYMKPPFRGDDSGTRTFGSLIERLHMIIFLKLSQDQSLKTCKFICFFFIESIKSQSYRDLEWDVSLYSKTIELYRLKLVQMGNALGVKFLLKHREGRHVIAIWAHCV